MLLSAKKIVTIEIFPMHIEKLRKVIESVGKKGVNVIVRLYEPCEIKHCKIYLSPTSSTHLEFWKKQ